MLGKKKETGGKYKNFKYKNKTRRQAMEIEAGNTLLYGKYKEIYKNLFVLKYVI